MTHRSYCKQCGDSVAFETAQEMSAYVKGHKAMHATVRIGTERGMLEVPAGSIARHGGSVAYIPMTRGREVVYVRPALRARMEREGYAVAVLPAPAPIIADSLTEKEVNEIA